MPEKKVPTRKFLVIKRNTLDYEVGDVVDLTARQAKNLTGKVRAYSDVEKEASAGNEMKALAQENEALKKEVESLKAELAKKAS